MRKGGFSALGIQTGPFTALEANFVLAIFNLCHLYTGRPILISTPKDLLWERGVKRASERKEWLIPCIYYITNIIYSFSISVNRYRSLYSMQRKWGRSAPSFKQRFVNITSMQRGTIKRGRDLANWYRWIHNLRGRNEGTRRARYERALSDKMWTQISRSSAY